MRDIINTKKAVEHVFPSAWYEKACARRRRWPCAQSCKHVMPF